MIKVVTKKNSKTDEEIIKNQIKMELEKLKFNFSYIGTRYLFEALYILITLNLYYNFNLEKDIYPIIANEYGITIHNIKNNIANAIDMMFYDCDEKILKKYMGEYFL